MLDLFTRNFCIVAADDGGNWCDAAREAAADLGLALEPAGLAGTVT